MPKNKIKDSVFGSMTIEFFDMKSKDKNGIVRRSERFTQFGDSLWKSDQRPGYFKQVFVPATFQHKQIITPNKY